MLGHILLGYIVLESKHINNSKHIMCMYMYYLCIVWVYAWTHFTWLYSTMTPNIKGTDSSIFSIYIAHLVPHPVLYFPDVVHSTRKQHAYLGFSERTPSTFILLHRRQHPSIQTTINHFKHRYCSCYTGK